MVDLEHRVNTLEKELADLKLQLEKRPSTSQLIQQEINLTELRKQNLNKRLANLSSQEERQVVLAALAKLDCFLRSLRQMYVS